MEGKPCDLLARIAADPAFQADEAALENALSPENYIGCAQLQTLEYLQTVIEPLLERSAGENVRVQEINV